MGENLSNVGIIICHLGVKLKKKDEAFKKRVSCPEAYKTARDLLKVHERVAYAMYRKRLTAKLSSDCTKS